jgi:diguanylate cyclase (GGDEF)-like protein
MSSRTHLSYSAIHTRRSNRVDTLIHQTPVITLQHTVDSVADIFYNDPTLYSIAVVDSNHLPVGIVRRHDFMHLFLSRYGRELYGRKLITHFMDNHPLIIESDLSLEEASRYLTSGSRLSPEHDFIIAEKGIYRGLGHIMDLLQAMTELQIRNAHYANPLTQLPGNVPIYEHIESLLEKKINFAVAYCDLDNFKPFNDIYGYDQGDKVIKAVAQLLVENMDEACDFVGHVGGDDFIVVMQSMDWVARCESVLSLFEVQALTFYNERDRQSGGIHSFDRKGNPTFYPFLSLSIGAVMPDTEACQSHHDVATLASEAKHQAKLLNGNQLFIDRRRKPVRTGFSNEM